MKFKRTFLLLLGLSVASYTMRLNTAVVDVGNINLKKFSSTKTLNYKGLARGPTIDKKLGMWGS